MSPIHVEDIAKIFVKSLSNQETIGNTYELGGDEKTWKELSCLGVTITYVKWLIAVDTTLPSKFS